MAEEESDHYSTDSEVNSKSVRSYSFNGTNLTCVVSGCMKPRCKRGYCTKHYVTTLFEEKDAQVDVNNIMRSIKTPDVVNALRVKAYSVDASASVTDISRLSSKFDEDYFIDTKPGKPAAKISAKSHCKNRSSMPEIPIPAVTSPPLIRDQELKRKLSNETSESLGFMKSKMEESQLKTSNFEKFTFAGWVYKRGVFNSSWKKRWMVLDGKYLYYFDSKQVLGNNPNGIISLSGVSLSSETGTESQPFCFMIFGGALSKNSRIFHLAVSTASEKDKWMIALDRAITSSESDFRGHSGALVSNLRFNDFNIMPVDYLTTSINLSPLSMPSYFGASSDPLPVSKSLCQDLIADLASPYLIFESRLKHVIKRLRKEGVATESFLDALEEVKWNFIHERNILSELLASAYSNDISKIYS